MKKKLICLLSLIICSFLYNKANINASTITDDVSNLLIAEIGAGSDDILLKGDVDSVNTNVNWNETGYFQVSCIKDNITFERDLIIANHNELLNGIYYSKKKKTIDANLYMTSFKAMFINDDDYFVYYNFKDNNINKTTFIYYENNDIVSTNTINNYCIKDALIYNNNLYALNEINNKLSCLIINSNCNIVREYAYTSNREEYAISLNSFNSELFICFNTTSNTGIIERSASYKVGVIMNINALTLEKESTKLISNNNESYIISTYQTDVSILLEMMFTGSSGSYKNTLNDSYEGKMIIEYNKTKTFVKASISATNNYKCLYYNSSCYYLVNDDLYSHTLECYYNDYINEKNYSFELPNNTCYVTYAINNDELLCFINDANNVIETLSINKNTLTVLACFSGFYPVDEVIVANNNIYSFYVDDTIYLNKMEIYKAYWKDEESVDVNIECAHLKKNNNELSLIYDIANDKMYGKYNLNIYAYSSSCSFVFKSEMNTNLKVNITDGGVYDTGLTLTFNSTAYLNNTKIESGYTINDIGNYVLEIEGTNAPNIKLTFQVLDLSCGLLDNDIKRIDEIKDSYNCYYQDYEYNKEANNMRIEYYAKELENENIDYIFYIVLACIISIGGIIIFVRYIHKKRGGKLCKH